ncbi:Metalloenzyme, LuxS/M16 peptidase-like protein [Sphaerosporella brunnea]|uniref:Presequence protease, mitochondrial n=1 Tax=Sphaerosporella brunnea TaxID=1250544 RepID=A0A5J5EXB2_9PEZI|nr:Metalloenzyme, LuxS/M16 peptidase-like protein [Sphaerosporella brunnea]
MASHPHFRIVTKFRTDYSPSEITKYESLRTGMTAVVVDREGPKVHGFFAFATEIFDDSGAPHTLEHLCFMGSRSYPYKGILDRLATRAYSETNAWTATDHTAYTLDTAGWAGFAQILPVYLEHTLLPTLTDAGCLTEVHHINGEGQDAGVVYSEMQGVQNTQETLMNEKATKMLYPEGIGFRYETGGMMEALRVLTADRIRQFHKEMYQPKNLCVVIIGEVDHDDLLKVLDKFEDGIIKDVPELDFPWRRPWVDSKPVPLLKKSEVAVVEFPEKDESMGEVMVGLLGPNCMDPVAATAVDVMSMYLAGSSVSVLEKTLVDIDDPWCSAVRFYSEDRPNTVLWIQLTAVATEKLAQAEKKLWDVLKETVEKPLNMEYLTDLIHRDRRQTKFYAENTGHSFSTPIITDHLFGNRDGSQLKESLETLGSYDVLEKWSDQEWRDFMREWLVDNHHVSILGRPSAKLLKKMDEDEKKRIADRMKKLGPEGLKELEAKLQAAKAKNEKEIPPEVVGQFKVPDVDTIHFIKTTTVRAGLAAKDSAPDNELQKTIMKENQDIPLYLHFESVPSDFIHLNLFISTDAIPVKLRPLMPVYWELFFDLPLMMDGKRVEYEQVVSLLEKDTVNYGISSGAYVDMPEGVRIRLQIEPEKYADAIKWLKMLLWDSIFDQKRIGTILTKLRSDIPDEKRQGKNMVGSVRKMVELAPESIGRAQDTLVKSKYLKRIEALLKEDPDAVVKQFEEFRQALCQIGNFRFLVIANLEKLQAPVTAWKTFVEGKTFDGKLASIDKRIDRLLPAGQKPGGVANIVSMPTIDNSYSVHTAKGPSAYEDPQLPALMLALAYLGATEGPLWNAARGNGLAYGVYISRNQESGHLAFDVYRSPDAYKAFAAVRDVVSDLANGVTPFDDNALEGAVSSIVVFFADNELNMSGAGTSSFIRQVVHGIPKDFNTELLRRIKKVTVDDIKKVLKELVLACFDPEKSNVVVVSTPLKANEIMDQFRKDGFKVELKTLKDFEDDYGLKYGLKDGEEEEEDEEEEGSEDGEGSDEEYTEDED